MIDNFFFQITHLPGYDLADMHSGFELRLVAVQSPVLA